MPHSKTLRAALTVAAMFVAGAASADSATDLMKGAGGARVLANGKTVFTFVVPANAYRGIIAKDDTASLRAQHDYILSAWVGREKICPKGYTVRPPQTVDGMMIYEGACR